MRKYVDTETRKHVNTKHETHKHDTRNTPHLSTCLRVYLFTSTPETE